MVKYLDDLLTVHYLLNVAFGSGNGFLLPDKVLGRTCADFACNEHHYNDSDDHYQSEPDAVTEHRNKYRDNDDTRSDNVRDGHGYELS